MLDGMKTINVGDSLHLYCKTTGYPTPSIVWKKNGLSLSELSSRVTFLPYGGLDNGHLVVFDVSGSEAGEYTCEAESEYFNSATSRLKVEVKGTGQIYKFLTLLSEADHVYPVIFFHDVTELSIATSPTLLIAIIVGSVVVFMAIVCCGVYVKCNQRAKKKNYACKGSNIDKHFTTSGFSSNVYFLHDLLVNN